MNKTSLKNRRGFIIPSKEKDGQLLGVQLFAIPPANFDCFKDQN